MINYSICAKEQMRRHKICGTEPHKTRLVYRTIVGIALFTAATRLQWVNGAHYGGLKHVYNVLQPW